jgi:hypothetical protein
VWNDPRFVITFVVGLVVIIASIDDAIHNLETAGGSLVKVVDALRHWLALGLASLDGVFSQGWTPPPG